MKPITPSTKTIGYNNLKQVVIEDEGKPVLVVSRDEMDGLVKWWRQNDEPTMQADQKEYWRARHDERDEQEKRRKEADARRKRERTWLVHLANGGIVFVTAQVCTSNGGTLHFWSDDEDGNFAKGVDVTFAEGQWCNVALLDGQEKVLGVRGLL